MSVKEETSQRYAVNTVNAKHINSLTVRGGMVSDKMKHYNSALKVFRLKF